MNDDNDIPLLEKDDIISELNPTAPEQSQQPHANNKPVQYTVIPP